MLRLHYKKPNKMVIIIKFYQSVQHLPALINLSVYGMYLQKKNLRYSFKDIKQFLAKLNANSIKVSTQKMCQLMLLLFVFARILIQKQMLLQLREGFVNYSGVDLRQLSIFKGSFILESAQENCKIQ
ncbi:unnamed protein product [Paramecium octaurelia]|uniref:Uncharacterized protein n=1 Tax=Paramecium octaurelia TaxID=43137 RepID=A0A8S1UBL7_PAROT|nr:unnamed protein product [Paramecium octaurelia]